MVLTTQPRRQSASNKCQARMFQLRLLLLVGVLHFIFGHINAADTSNDIELDHLLDLEGILMHQLEDFIFKKEQQQDKMLRFLKYAENFQIDDAAEAEKYYGNPLNAFSTLNRVVNSWRHEVLDLVESNADFEQYKKTCRKIFDEHEVQEPTTDHLLSATQEILELQTSNNLHPSDLANGVVSADGKSRLNVTLNANDCYVIGRELHLLRHNEEATEWLLLARSRAAQEALMFPSVTKEQIHVPLITTLEALGSHKLANRLNNQILKQDPQHKMALFNKIRLDSKVMLERGDILSLKHEL